MYIRLLLLSLGLTGVASLLWFIYQSFKITSIPPDPESDGKSNQRELHATTRVHLDSISGINELASLTSDNVNLNPNDGHNVHNITVVNAVKNTMLPLLKNSEGPECSFIQVVQQLKQYVKNHELQLSLPNLNTVLKFIIDSRAKYSKDRIKEFDILKLIWKRVNHSKNSDNYDKIMSEFVNQLNDCFEVEKGAVCCLEGRIIRYFQVLELHDFENSQWCLVPLWYYKEEIERLCAKRLDEMVNGLSLDDQMIYLKSEPLPGEQRQVDKWNNELIANLETEITQEYGTRIEQDLLDGIVKPCFEAIMC